MTPKDSKNKRLWGIDLGGTKVEGIVLKPDTNETLFRDRLLTEAEKGYEHVLDQIDRLIRLMSDEVEEQPTEIGIGTPGIIDPQTQKLKNSSNAVCLNNKTIKKDLENRLNVGIEIANDAHCFALAETRYGIVSKRFPKATVIFGAIMGTGVGGGIVVNNQLLTGHHGIGGEWGHNFLDQSGYECFCGKKGCVEKVISGTALEKYYTQKTEKKLSLKEIVDRAEQGIDQIAEDTLQRLIYFFGKAVSMIVNIVDPDVIVVGGGVSNINQIFTDGRSEIEKHIFNDEFHTPVVKPMLGDASGVIGAAYLTDLE